MKRNKLLQSLALALLGCATSMPVHAELKKVSTGNYEIASDSDYEEFRQMVATGNPYANAVLTNDITVKDAIGKGDVQFHYRGTFDGQGHTITLDNLTNDTDNHPWGLFQYTESGCVICNLRVIGTAENMHEAMGSIVGEARGTRIENCISEVDLKAKIGSAGFVFPGGYTGGLIGASYGVNFVENCAFVGSIYAAEAYGIVGYVNNNVEIKSCYVDATFSNPYNSRQFILKNDESQILLNNYYHQRGGDAPADETGATAVDDNALTNGKLCFDLNLGGRKGCVWYQHSDYPYPFQGTDGLVATKSDAGNIVVYNRCNRDSYEHGICQNCGNISSGTTVVPLQTTVTSGNEVCINNYRFKLNVALNPRTAEFLGLSEDASPNITAVHIPETIIVDDVAGGVEYIVDYVKSEALKDSKLEYLYISKNVNHIDNRAFSGCTALKYLHIADRPDDDVDQRLKLESGTNGNGLFYDCPLENVYIGKHLRWGTSNPVPFYNHATIQNVFWGPRVKRIGNYFVAAQPREGNADAFEGCSVKNIYFLGDDQTLAQDDVEVWMYKGLCNATDFYINRTIKITDDIDEYTTFWKNGIFLSCKNVAFGPFAKYIGENLFGGGKTSYNHTLKLVDFINANRLERIDTEAFYECPDAVFVGLEGQYPLKTIGDYAFYNCDNLDYINLGTELQSIGKSAFDDCAVLNFISIPGTVTAIGDDAFDDCIRLQGISFEAGSTALDFSQLGGRFDGDTKYIASLYLNRNITNVPLDPLAVGQDSPFDRSDGSLTNLTIGPEVSALYRGLFYGLNAITSLTFEYSSVPLVFDRNPGWVFDCGESGIAVNHNPVSSLRIDRYLNNYHSNGDKDYSLVKGSDWGASQTLIRDITFGEHITRIHESEYEGFSGLQTVLFSPNIETIASNAFKNAASNDDLTKGLSTVTFTGPTIIREGAFDGCKDLETIIVCDPGLVVENGAFANCDKIKEITVVSDGITAEGSESAFSESAYENAILYSPFDTSAETVVFSQNPWKQFMHRPLKRANDYLEEPGQASSGVYEHASVQVDIDKDKYVMFYAPFAWESYYFGADAEVYTLSVNNGCYEESATSSGEFTTYDICLRRVDLLDAPRLPMGVYLVKTSYPAESISATRNLFVEYEGINVDNRFNYIQSAAENKFTFGGMGGDMSDNQHSAYVIEDGVLKQLNGHYDVMNSGVVFASGKTFNEDYETFNIQYNGNTLFTSKRAVPFHELLGGYATFYNKDFNLCAPQWCEVYVVTSVADGSVALQKISDRIINAGQAVILKTSKEAAIGANDFMTYVANGSSATDLYDQNLLRGVNEETPVSEISGSEGYVYVLSCNSQNTNIGFYKFGNGNKLGAGKAYLEPSGLSNAAKACLFTFDDAANAIDNAVVNSNVGVAYDLMGKRIDTNQADAKGIYIIDNKKVIK